MEVQWAGISLPNREATRTAVVGSETGVVPDVNQIQLSPDIARTVPRRAHEVLGIVTESWSPLGRGPELRVLLSALNTGHDGGAGTLHASSLADVPARLEALGASAGIEPGALARQVISAIDAIIHLEQHDGIRRIAHLGRPELTPAGLLAITPVLGQKFSGELE